MLAGMGNDRIELLDLLGKGSVSVGYEARRDDEPG